MGDYGYILYFRYVWLNRFNELVSSMEARKMNFEYEIINCLSDEEFKELIYMILNKTKIKMEKDKLNSLLSDKVSENNL